MSEIENYTKPIDEKNWKDAFKELGLIYVNYQYHKDVCAKSLERLEQLEQLKRENEELKHHIHKEVEDIMKKYGIQPPKEGE